MAYSENKALEITTTLVNSKLQNSSISVNANGGKYVADFFKEIYNGVKEITSNMQSENK